MPNAVELFPSQVLDNMLGSLTRGLVPWELRVLRSDATAEVISEAEYMGRPGGLVANRLAGLMEKARHWKAPQELLAAYSPVPGGLRLQSGPQSTSIYGWMASAADEAFRALAADEVKDLPAAARYAGSRLTLPLTELFDLEVRVSGAHTSRQLPVTLTQLFGNGRDFGGSDKPVPVSSCITLPLGAFSDYRAVVTIGGQMEAEAYRQVYSGLAGGRIERINPIVASQTGPPLNRSLFESAMSEAEGSFAFTSVDALVRRGAPVISRTHNIVSDELSDTSQERVRRALSNLHPRSIGSFSTGNGSVVEFATDAGMVRWQLSGTYSSIATEPLAGENGTVPVATPGDALLALTETGADSWQDSVRSACAHFSKTVSRTRGSSAVSDPGSPQL